MSGIGRPGDLSAERARCPICGYSVRVEDGRFVPHAAILIPVAGGTARECAGSDQRVDGT